MAEENKKNEIVTPKKHNFPDVYALLFGLCILAMIATWLIPAGSFDRVMVGKINKVVAGSFHYISGTPQNPWDMLQAIYKAFIKSAPIIYMIFFCGAAISMLEETKSLSTAFTVMARKLEGKEAISIALIMFGLGLGNSAGVFGNIGVAILPIGVFMSRAIGGDGFLGFLIVYFGLMAGFSVGFANPGIVGFAQTLAEIPIFSGTPVRAACCIANIIFLYCVTMIYYKKIKKEPTFSLNYEQGMKVEEYIGNNTGDTPEEIEHLTITKRQMATVVSFMIGVIICVTLTIKFRWGQQQIASWFLGLAVMVGIVSGFSPNEIAKKFIKGCLPMVSASFVTGVASAVALILNNGKVMDTIVHILSMPVGQMGAVAGAGFMVVLNGLINILVPSGSGQAAVVMPLMVPIADLVGITRQVAVQAFQFGDGLGNLITPLNGPMMGCLALAGVSFPKYIKWAAKWLAIQFIGATIITMILQATGWTGL